MVGCRGGIAVVQTPQPFYKWNFQTKYASRQTPPYRTYVVIDFAAQDDYGDVCPYATVELVKQPEGRRGTFGTLHHQVDRLNNRISIPPQRCRCSLSRVSKQTIFMPIRIRPIILIGKKRILTFCEGCWINCGKYIFNEPRVFWSNKHCVQLFSKSEKIFIWIWICIHTTGYHAQNAPFSSVSDLDLDPHRSAKDLPPGSGCAWKMRTAVCKLVMRAKSESSF